MLITKNHARYAVSQLNELTGIVKDYGLGKSSFM